MSAPPIVGVIGLGRMGQAIATRLDALGLSIMGWNRTPRPVSKFALADTLADLVAASDILILSLFDDAAVRDVLGQLADLQLERKLIVDTSTVSPAILPEFASAIAAQGARVVDAPISGGPEMVLEGRAGMFLGGASEDVARFQPIADHLAAAAPHVGSLGSGAAAKIVNNMMLCGLWQTLKEAMLVGQAHGLSTKTMLGFLENSPAASPALKSRIDVLTGASERVGFPVSGAVKDTGLFLSVARDSAVETPVIAAGHASFKDTEEGGHGAADLAAMVRIALGE